MSQGMHSKPVAGNKTLRIAGAVTSSLTIVAAAGFSAVMMPFTEFVDSGVSSQSATSQQVSPRQLMMYCPAQMQLADSGSYGDSQFQVSAGDLQSSARYAAFGAVYSSEVSALADDGSDSVTLSRSDTEDQNLPFIASSDAASSAMQNTRLLESKDGTGSVSSVMSWATAGDLRGVSAASCLMPSLNQSFILDGTQTGTTQQLIAANLSSKATSVTIRAWGTDDAGELKLNTNATLSVPAHSESTFDLSAAASKQDGLYVTVSSAQTPIAAYVRTVSMDGLTPKGSEYAVPVTETEGVTYIPSVRQGDGTELVAYSKKEQDITVSWIGESGANDSRTHHLDADRVTVIDMGDAPDGVLALQVESDSTATFSATLARSDGGEGQEDFALSSSPTLSKVSAIAIPDHADTELTFVAAKDAEATVTAYDADGKVVESRDITLRAGHATSLQTSDFGDGVAVVAVGDNDGNMTWGARVSEQSVSDAGLSGLSVLKPEALTVATELIWANSDPTIVR